MDHFDYRNGSLHAEDVDVADIAAAIGTPFYCYSTATFERHYRIIDSAFDGLEHLICYSLKANSNQAVIRTLANLGAGADVVSEGELRRALAAGIPADKIVFSGIGKRRPELEFALAAGIRQFNVESMPELEALNEIALSRGKRAPISFRVNPDVDPKTHRHISTGLKENKFGIPWNQVAAAYDAAASLEGIDIVGVDVHIGSQLTELAPFEEAFRLVAGLVPELRAAGHSIERVDIGGGLGIPYAEPGDNEDAPPPLPTEYGQLVKETLGHLDCEIQLEPGRLIAGNAGILVAELIYIKEGDATTFMVLDAAMNDLIRPALYDAHHQIVPVVEPDNETDTIIVDVVGPVCETADRFAKGRPMPSLSAGDLVAIRSAGAYGAVQASGYNTRPLVPEVMVNGDRFEIVRPRPTYDDIIASDILPSWLS